MANLDEAKRLFRVYTGDTGRIDALYGPAKASCRAHILSELQGKRVPQSKAGWTLFHQAMIDLYGIGRDCTRNQDRQLGVAACPDAWELVTDEWGSDYRLKRRGMPVFA